MTTSQNLPWKRIAVEAAAIVGSILLAFSIDAWWDDHQDRQRERELLEVLLVEFESMEGYLGWSRNYYGAIRASALRLVDIGMGVEENATDEEIDKLLEDLWWWSVPAEWNSAELSSIISSGDLALISNDSLRRNIGGWPVTLSSVRDVIIREHDFYRERFMPYLSKHTSLQQLAMAGDGTPGHPQSDYNYGHKFELENKQSHRELLSQSDFQNLLIERAYNLNDILVLALGDETDPGWVSGSIGITIDLLEQELAE